MDKLHHLLGRARESLGKGKSSISKISDMQPLIDRSGSGYHEGFAHEAGNDNWVEDNPITTSFADGIFQFEIAEDNDIGFILYEGGWGTDGLDESDIWGLNAPEHFFGWIDPFD